ncbi:hypothetical protein CPTAbTP3Phi1_013 [Acinetobacter phage AbTP3phi1]|uniref:Uncharacterized protein n=1 Tax=Acinetobacter phage AbTP3phi1 TaxID=2920932 RepID=A0AC61TTF2_9CAUD|nr:hypothetical protein CPTAbTP3Phi1_013 [Acinetobacter phage AbTP3phi1]
MHGHKYSAGDRVYRTVGSHNIPKGAKGTVGDGRIGQLFQVHLDNGHIWFCSNKFIKPLVRVVG